VKVTRILFVHTKGMGVAKIHPEFCTLYGKNKMNVGTVRQYFKMGVQTNVHDEEKQNCWQSIVSDVQYWSKC
jgi:hypothetical protein